MPLEEPAEGPHPGREAMALRAAMAPQRDLADVVTQAAGVAQAIDTMNYPRLKALAAVRGVDVSQCREKAELVAALGAAAWRDAALAAAMACLPADATARRAGRAAAHAAAHAAFLRRRSGGAASEDDAAAVVAAAVAAAEAAAAVHPKIQDAVAEALVVRARAARPAPARATRPLKCHVCTLPHGTCAHTRTWFALRATEARTAREARLAAARDEAARSVFERRAPALAGVDAGDAGLREDLARLARDVLAHAPPRPPSPRPWRPSGAPVCAWSALPTTEAVPGAGRPAPRRDHTLVALGRDRLVCFGGRALVSKLPNAPEKAFAAYATVLTVPAVSTERLPEQTVAYYGPEVHVLDLETDQRVWHRVDPRAEPSLVSPRAGHCAVALDDERMWVFGGRGSRGRYFNDVAVLRLPRPAPIDPRLDPNKKELRRLNQLREPAWVEIADNGGEAPDPRCSAAAQRCGDGKVCVFGGRDGTRCFGGPWLHDPATGVWSHMIVLGAPPADVFGHALIPLPAAKVERGAAGAFLAEVPVTRLLVLGGSSLKSGAGAAASERARAADRRAAELAAAVSESYAAEGPAAVASLESGAAAEAYRVLVAPRAAGAARAAARSLAAAQAVVAGDAFRREEDAARLGDALLALDSDRAGARRGAEVNPLRGALKVLDVKDGAWVDVRAGGADVTARRDFCCVTLGLRPCFADRAVALGGRDGAGAPAGEAALEPHVLDLRALAWASPAPRGMAAALTPAVVEAGARAKEARTGARAARDRARCRGDAPDGDIMVVAAADAAAARAAFLAETRAARAAAESAPPGARAGCAMAAILDRVFVFGGAALDDGAPLDDLVVLDLEDVEGRERRETVEFHGKLERARVKRDAEDAREAKRVAWETYWLLERWAANEAVERVKFGEEHVRSAVPPLTVAPPVTLHKASPCTMWLRWRAVPRDARRRPCEPEFLLCMRGGFRELRVGEAVLVAWEPRPTTGDAADSDADSDASEAPGGGAAGAEFPGVVAADPRDGAFDVEYEDGMVERGVPRRRIRPVDAGAWTPIYAGADNAYAVEALVPDRAVRDEPGLSVACEFVLRTQGTEYGWDKFRQEVVKSDEFSRPSPVAAFRTAETPAAPEPERDARGNVIPKPTEFRAAGAGRHFV